MIELFNELFCDTDDGLSIFDLDLNEFFNLCGGFRYGDSKFLGEFYEREYKFNNGLKLQMKSYSDSNETATLFDENNNILINYKSNN